MRLNGPPAQPGVAAQLALGIERGLEPRVAFADDGATGVVTTRSSSWWNFRRCKTCGHTFRRGDQALVDPVGRTAQHLAPGLRCGSDPGAAGPTAARTASTDTVSTDTVSTDTGPPDAAEPGRDRDDFAAGLLMTWPSAVPVTRIGASDWRLPRPGSGRQAPTCLYCGHTFRPGEYVVTCPCRTSLGADPACGAAVHRDPAAGLPCWENWQPGGALTVCPTTSARL